MVKVQIRLQKMKNIFFIVDNQQKAPAQASAFFSEIRSLQNE
jgi:hypothetical protein